MEWSVRLATPRDIPYLAKNLRQTDKDEVFASSGRTVTESLENAFTLENSDIYVGTYNGNPEIIFGICPMSKGSIVGFPWMLCTDQLKKSPKEFMRRCKDWVDKWNNKYPVLTNMVYARNSLHIRWLKWCGFKFIKLHPQYGHSKEPFWEFYKTKE